MGIGEVCTREVVVVTPNETILTAARLMKEHAVGDVIVTENGRPTGILTDRDITVRAVVGKHNPETTPVKTLMSGSLVTVDEDAGIGDSIRLMRSKGIRRLPVVDSEDRLVGIITLDDLLDLLAEEMESMVGLIRWQQNRSQGMV